MTLTCEKSGRLSRYLPLWSVCLLTVLFEPRTTHAQQEVDAERELLIRDLSVVEDPWRAPEPCDSQGDELGVWSFGYLMGQLATQAGSSDPAQFVRTWLETWAVNQQINGYQATARPRIGPVVIDPWLARSGGGSLDLARAPFRLLAVVSRVDLRRTIGDQPIDAGEGRFVFGLVDTSGGAGTCRLSPLRFEVIFEYKLRANSVDEVINWANRWHALGQVPFGPEYSDALEALTEEFIQEPSSVRTNECVLEPCSHQLRQFILNGGRLQPVAVDQTPNFRFSPSAALRDFINDNEDVILAGAHTVPPAWFDADTYQSIFWFASGINNPEARHLFGLATCGGCHGFETGNAGATAFSYQHVSPRALGQIAELSGYLLGIEANYYMPYGQPPHAFHELQRRADDLLGLLNSGFSPPSGAHRVH